MNGPIFIHTHLVTRLQSMKIKLLHCYIVTLLHYYIVTLFIGPCIRTMPIFVCRDWPVRVGNFLVELF